MLMLYIYLTINLKQYFLLFIKPPNSHYSSNPSIVTPSRTNGTNTLTLGNASSSQHFLYAPTTSTPMVTTFTPSSRMPYPVIAPSMMVENAAYVKQDNSYSYIFIIHSVKFYLLCLASYSAVIKMMLLECECSN